MQPVVVVAHRPAAQGGKVATHQGRATLLHKQLVIAVPQGVQVGGIVLVKSVGPPPPREIARGFRPAPSLGIGHHRLHPEEIHAVLFGVVEQPRALECPARVGPVQRADQPLRAEQQLLPAETQHRRCRIPVKQLHFGEQVQEIRRVLVRQYRGQAVVPDFRRDELRVDPEVIVVPEIREHPRPEQVIVVQHGPQPAVVLVHVPVAHIAAGGHQPVVPQRDPLQLIQQRKGTVLPGWIHLPEVQFEKGLEYRADRRPRGRGERFPLNTPQPVDAGVIPRTLRWGILEEPGFGKHLGPGDFFPPVRPPILFVGR